MMNGGGAHRTAVDDKEEVTEQQTNSGVRRMLTYDDAVNQAFPEEMFSHELANGIAG